MTDTIFAPATAPGRAGIAVIRVSGPAAFASAATLGAKNLVPRTAKLVALHAPQNINVIIDHALVIAFPGPASYTGEDITEYHVHGGRAVVQSLMDALSNCPGHRIADPGEFTRRAFENGRMDLTAAEAVADLIAAETEAQKLQALSQMGGALAALYEGWREALKKILAHQEADIEFPDEDMPDGLSDSLRPDIHSLAAAIESHLNDNRRGERLRDGYRVAILGAPNAGKSSLINALMRRDVAIVSPMAGTTRDVIEAHLDISGFPVILADTAGLRDVGAAGENANTANHESIEAEGIRRSRARAQDADITILLFDGTLPQDAATDRLADDRALAVFNKSDLPGFTCPPGGIAISAQRGDGMPDFLNALAAKIGGIAGDVTAPSLTRARHREALDTALAHLNSALTARMPELAAEDLRLAMRAIGRITGRVDVEDLLDVIFRDFCIGK